MSTFFSHDVEGGYYSITTIGFIAFAVLIAALLVVAAFITDAKKEEKSKGSLFSTRKLVFCAVLMALGFATSYIKIIPMPWGGSVTLCSMLFVTLIGYWYGPKVGLICGLAYGTLQFLQDGGSYVLSPLQVCLDYFVAFMALGASGFFNKKDNGLLIGYIVAILLRGVFHSIGGYIYWMEYMPENFPQSLAFIYPIAYNYAYILLEGVITVVILLIPSVKKALANGKVIATEGM